MSYACVSWGLNACNKLKAYPTFKPFACKIYATTLQRLNRYGVDTDSPLTCRVCSRYNKIEPAVAILNTPTVQNWSVCRDHANVIARSMVDVAYEFTYIQPGDRLGEHESEAD